MLYFSFSGNATDFNLRRVFNNHLQMSRAFISSSANTLLHALPSVTVSKCDLYVILKHFSIICAFPTYCSTVDMSFLRTIPQMDTTVTPIPQGIFKLGHVDWCHGNCAGSDLTNQHQTFFYTFCNIKLLSRIKPSIIQAFSVTMNQIILIGIISCKDLNMFGILKHECEVIINLLDSLILPALHFITRNNILSL